MKPLYRISNARTGNPVIHRNPADPAGQFGNLRQAKSALTSKIANIKRGMRELVEYQASQAVTVTNAAKYEYLIDTQRYDAINLFIQRLLYSELLDDQQGQFNSRWWLLSRLTQAYEDGTGDALQSAKNIAPVEVVGVELSQAMRSIQVEQILFSPGFQMRLGLVHARTFNEMKGLTDQMKTDLAETLTRGMAAGKGMRELTKDVLARVGVTESRAWRIARTETLNAYRTATSAETDELNAQVYTQSDWQMRQLWFSSLAPTTRPNHARRHGRVYTTEEVREFYSQSGETINCLCSQSPILINIKTGEAIQQSLLDRMEKQREAFEIARGMKKAS